MDWRTFLDINRASLDSPYEASFVEHVLSAVPGLDFQTVDCQTPFVDSSGVERRIDFTISDGDVRLALEVDGWDKSGRGTGMTRTEFVAWSRRELEMTSQGWTVLRFANSLVTHRPEDCARHVHLTLARERAEKEAGGSSEDTVAADLTPDEANELARLESERKAALQELEARLSAAEAENRGMKQAAWPIVAAVAVTAFAAVAIVFITRPSPQQSPETPGFCEGGLPWQEAASHIGERVAVLGPVVGTSFQAGTNGQPTFLNVGRDFPDPSRLTVVIWGRNRMSFPEPPEIAFANSTVCVRGLVQEYRGRIEIEVDSPGFIEMSPP